MRSCGREWARYDVVVSWESRREGEERDEERERREEGKRKERTMSREVG